MISAFFRNQIKINVRRVCVCMRPHFLRFTKISDRGAMYRQNISLTIMLIILLQQKYFDLLLYFDAHAHIHKLTFIKHRSVCYLFCCNIYFCMATIGIKTLKMAFSCES